MEVASPVTSGEVTDLEKGEQAADNPDQNFSAWHAKLRPQGIALTVEEEDHVAVTLNDGSVHKHYFNVPKISMKKQPINDAELTAAAEALAERTREIEKGNYEMKTNVEAYAAGRKLVTDFAKAQTAVVAKAQAQTEAAVEVTAEVVEQLAKAFQQRHHCSPRDARIGAEMAIADGSIAKLATKPGMLASLAQQHSLSKAGAGDFNKCVDAIKVRDGCSHKAALQKARIEHPEAFAAYQG